MRRRTEQRALAPPAQVAATKASAEPASSVTSDTHELFEVCGVAVPMMGCALDADHQEPAGGQSCDPHPVAATVAGADERAGAQSSVGPESAVTSAAAEILTPDNRSLTEGSTGTAVFEPISGSRAAPTSSGDEARAEADRPPVNELRFCWIAFREAVRV